MTQIDLGGRRAIVTGGASGIGRATALRLAELGAVVVVTDVDDAGGTAVAGQIDGTYQHLDVGRPTEWEAVVAEHGPFDIAFLNAGVSTDSGIELGALPIVDLTDEAYRRIMSINVDGVVWGARAVMPGMIERGRGDIVATASMAGLAPIAPDPIYGLTKHAVVGFVRSLAAAFDAHPADVCVSAICPGFVDTNIITEDFKSMLVETKLGLLGADEVADTVARSLDERVNGAQWVMWDGVETSVYEWTPAVDLSGFEAPDVSLF